MNNHEHENIITEEHKNRHDIKKYNFRNMEVAKVVKKESTASEQDSIQPQDEPMPQVAPPQPQVAQEPSIDAPALKLFEAEVVDKILQKSDVLADSLQKLKEQFDKQESEMESKILAAKEEAKAQGLNEGYQKAKAELEAQINSQKELYALSISRIDSNIAESKSHILGLEKELSAIALDIAREVITQEVSQNSSKVASMLARTLLNDLSKGAQVTLKVNPSDYEDLKDSLKDLSHVSIEADVAITKGGVIILSDEGNIDGDVFTRFEILKKSILENKE